MNPVSSTVPELPVGRGLQQSAITLLGVRLSQRMDALGPLVTRNKYSISGVVNFYGYLDTYVFFAIYLLQARSI